MIVGEIAVKSWSRTQRGRSLSSAEAEYYAIVTGVAEALAVQAMAEEMGWKMSVRVHTDSSAAKAVASRRGLGSWKINGLDKPATCARDDDYFGRKHTKTCMMVQSDGKREKTLSNNFFI